MLPLDSFRTASTTIILLLLHDLAFPRHIVQILIDTQFQELTMIKTFQNLTILVESTQNVNAFAHLSDSINNI